MATVNAYLTFDGNCEEAFNFYKQNFGGEFPFVGRFGDMPPSEEGKQIPEDQKNRIMHISLPISKETIRGIIFPSLLMSILRRKQINCLTDFQPMVL